LSFGLPGHAEKFQKNLKSIPQKRSSPILAQSSTGRDMSNQRQTDQTAKAVPRLVALLFALAVVAEWAATAPAPVRYAVLMILRRAETIASSIIYREMRDCGLTLQWALPGECRQYSDPQAAMLFGWWFRILAVALRDLPRRALFHKRRNASHSVTSLSMGEVAPQARVGVLTLHVLDADACSSLRQRAPPSPLRHLIQ
jgi:hypothetical protein